MMPESEVAYSLSDVGERRPTFLAIGVFDGVHLGHQRILRAMIAAARTAGARPAVMTFDPHPATVISGRSGRFYLTSLADRVRLLSEIGFDLVIVQKFDQETRSITALDFVTSLDDYLWLSSLWGANFSLGYQRQGDLPFLTEIGERMGFEVHHFQELVNWSGEPVSSSRIRRSLDGGDLAGASACLGRPYALSGVVIRGDARGRELGFPTANLDIWDQLRLPATGVYGGRAIVSGSYYRAAINVGYRPTVSGKDLTVEAHLPGFDEDIYGQRITIEFHQRIRSEQRFASLNELKAQIAADVAIVESMTGIYS